MNSKKIVGMLVAILALSLLTFTGIAAPNTSNNNTFEPDSHVEGANGGMSFLLSQANFNGAFARWINQDSIDLVGLGQGWFLSAAVDVGGGGNNSNRHLLDAFYMRAFNGFGWVDLPDPGVSGDPVTSSASLGSNSAVADTTSANIDFGIDTAELGPTDYGKTYQIDITYVIDY